MRNDQRNVSDYRHERTDTVSAVADDGQRPAMRDGEAPGEDRRSIAELEQLAHLLQELHATMNSTLDSVASAQRDHPAEAMIADTPPASGPAPEPSPAPMRRTGVILSVGGAAVLLGLLGWVWRGTPASDPGGMQSAELAGTVPVDETAALSASGAQAGPEGESRMASEEVNATTDEPPGPTDIAAAPAGVDDGAIREAVKDSPQPSLVGGEPLRGVAGEPIPLGILLPQAAISNDVSVAVEGVRLPATLTNGTRLGGDTWIIDARQADAVALLTPAAFPGGRMEMGVRLVSNDGRITEADRLTVSIEPPSPPAAPTEQVVSAAATAGASELIAAGGATRPVATSDGEDAESLAAAEMIEAQMMADAPPLQSGEEGQSLDAAGSPPREAGVAAAPLNAASVDLAAHASPEAQQSAGNAAHIAAAQEAAPTQDEAGIEPGAAQTPSPAVDSGKLPEPTRTEPVSVHVNMRAGPSNDAAVITVVPAGRRVGVIECDQWCEVTFADKRGWIHSRFVGEAPAPARPAAAAQTPSNRPRVATREARRRAPADNAAQRAASVATAAVTADVHMRAKPDDDSAVVAVVSGGSKVRVLECRQWCEVAFAGKRGWINARYVGKISAQKREGGGSKVGGWLKKLSPF